MYNRIICKSALYLFLSLAILAALVGCSSNLSPPEADGTAAASSADAAREEIDALLDENSRLQAELDASNEADRSASVMESEPERSETDVVSAETSSIAESMVPVSQTAPIPEVTAIVFFKSTDLTLNVGATNRRPATTTPAGGIVAYTSSNQAVATVASDGTVTCKAAGKTIITATSSGKSTSYNLTVVGEASSVPAASANTGTKSGALVGYTVQVDDSTTLATASAGDGAYKTYYFYSASGKVLGSMAVSEMEKVATQHMVKAGEEWVAPKGDWSAWFANEFNLYRGLSGEVIGGLPAGSIKKVDTESLRQEIIILSNKERESAGMPALVSDADAMAYAKIRAQEISVDYSHKRPNGESKMYGSYSFVEIIYKGPTTAQKAVSGWMNSPGHKASLLADYSKYGNKTGVGCFQNSDGTLYWVQVFVIWDENG